MAEYINIAQLWQCETCFHHGSSGCALGMFGCDHGESYRPAYGKLKKADVAPVVHGRWIWDEECDCWYCSNCEMAALNNYRGNSTDSHYCPNCGADMRGE